MTADQRDPVPDLAFQLLAAANYIDALGGVSKSYRAAIAAHETEQIQAPAEHTPADQNIEAAVDTELGIKLLPPIRVPAATAALIEKFAALEGVIVQSVVRDVLVERFSAQAPAEAHGEPVAWMYEHDGCHDEPILTMSRWPECSEPWNETPLDALALASHAIEKVWFDAVGTGNGEHSISEAARTRVEFAADALKLGLRLPGALRKTGVETPVCQVQPKAADKRGSVLVPLAVLEDASSSLGHYLSDRGWSDEDMQAMDNLDAYIARHKANAASNVQPKGTAARIRAEALEEAARQCEEVKAETERWACGADTGMYDHQAQGAENCAEAIRAFAAATATQAPAPAPEVDSDEKWEADVECITDESGTDYSVSIRGPGLRNPDYSDVWMKKRPAEQLVKWLNTSVLARFNVKGAAVGDAPGLPPPDAVAGYLPPPDGYAFAKETFRISEWMRPQTEGHAWTLEFYSRATVEHLLAAAGSRPPVQGIDR